MGESSAGVPEDLINELHRASEHFHESRQHLEEAMDGSNYRHQERVNAAGEELKQAEKKLEEVEEQIKKKLSPGS